jgi:predicted nucleic acid-binding protein
MIFCDTSTAVKLYVPEAESTAVRGQLEAEDEVFVSELARVELMGAFHRRLREGIWTREDLTAAVRQFTRDEISCFLTWLPMDNAIIDAAAKTYTSLSEKVYLRSADCLHLVTALHYNFGEIDTHNKHQAAAAVALGLKPVAIS